MTTETTDITSAEKAIAEALHLFLKGRGLIGPELPSDFYDAARDISAAAEGHHQVDAYGEAYDALGALASYHEGAFSPDWVDGVRTARQLIREQEDALRAELSEASA